MAWAMSESMRSQEEPRGVDREITVIDDETPWRVPDTGTLVVVRRRNAGWLHDLRLLRPAQTPRKPCATPPLVC